MLGYNIYEYVVPVKFALFGHVAAWDEPDERLLLRVLARQEALAAFVLTVSTA